VNRHISQNILTAYRIHHIIIIIGVGRWQQQLHAAVKHNVIVMRHRVRQASVGRPSGVITAETGSSVCTPT